MGEKEELIASYMVKFTKTFNLMIRTIYNAAFKAGKNEQHNAMQSFIEQEKRLAFNEGYSKAREEYIPNIDLERETSYQRGLADFAEAAKVAFGPYEKGGMYWWDRERVFGKDSEDFYDILASHTPEQFVDKVYRFKNHLPIEDEKPKTKKIEFCVGDEIRNLDTNRVFVVVRIEDDFANLIDKDGHLYVQDIRDMQYRKTGKHFDFNSVFENMSNGDETDG